MIRLIDWKPKNSEKSMAVYLLNNDTLIKIHEPVRIMSTNILCEKFPKIPSDRIINIVEHALVPFVRVLNRFKIEEMGEDQILEVMDVLLEKIIESSALAIALTIDRLRFMVNTQISHQRVSEEVKAYAKVYDSLPNESLYMLPDGQALACSIEI